jgi:hypothetical protein
MLHLLVAVLLQEQQLLLLLPVLQQQKHLHQQLPGEKVGTDPQHLTQQQPSLLPPLLRQLRQLQH